MTTSVFFDIGARDTSGAAFGSVVGGLDRTTAASNRLGSSFGGSSRGARTFGSGIQSMSRAVSRGESVMSALSGRASQLLGIFGPLGFVVGGLIGSFISLGEAGEDVDAVFNDLEGATSRLSQINGELETASGNVRAALLDERDAVIALAEAKLAQAEAAIQAIEAENRARAIANASERRQRERTRDPNQLIDEFGGETRRELEAAGADVDQDLAALSDDVDTLARIAEQRTTIAQARQQLEGALSDPRVRARRSGGAGGGSLSEEIERNTAAGAEQQATFASMAETNRWLADVNRDLNSTLDEQARVQEEAGREAATFADRLVRIGMSAQSATDALKALGLELLSEGLRGLLTGEGIFGALGDVAGSVIGSVAGIPGRASGGRVIAGMPYVVGEERPELFVPDQSGAIVPRVPEMRAGQAAAQISVGSTTINITEPGASPQQIQRIVADSRRETIREIVTMNRRNPRVLGT